MTRVHDLMKDNKLNQSTICANCNQAYRYHCTMDLPGGRGVVCYDKKGDKVFIIEQEEVTINREITSLLMTITTRLLEDYYKLNKPRVYEV